MLIIITYYNLFVIVIKTAIKTSTHAINQHDYECRNI